MDETAGGATAPPPTPPPAKPRRGAGRPCKVCNHPQRAEIEGCMVAGDDDQEISRKFAMKHDAVWRHRRDHVPSAAMQAAVAAREEAEGAQALDLLQTADDMRKAALRMARAAEDAGDLRTALAGIREVARLLDLMGRFRGELSNDVTINLQAAPIIIELQAVILTALSAHPAARLAVLAALEGIASPPTQLTLEHQP